MSLEDRLRAIVTPLNAAVREERAAGVVGPATMYQERAMNSAFEDALVGMLVKRGVITRGEWEEAFLAELQVKVAAVMAAVEQTKRRGR